MVTELSAVTRPGVNGKTRVICVCFSCLSFYSAAGLGAEQMDGDDCVSVL